LHWQSFLACYLINYILFLSFKASTLKQLTWPLFIVLFFFLTSGHLFWLRAHLYFSIKVTLFITTSFHCSYFSLQLILCFILFLVLVIECIVAILAMMFNWINLWWQLFIIFWHWRITYQFVTLMQFCICWPYLYH